ncbi:MAG: reprolysin-like metallopeptidase [Ferruginibacter sp.]
MKFHLKRITWLCIFFITADCCMAQNNFFKDAPENSFLSPAQKRVIVPARYRTLQMDTNALSNFLNTIAPDNSILTPASTQVIDIPMPDGGSAQFKIWETSVMEPGLAALFPEIKTYTGQGIDDLTANIKLDLTPVGFHAMILSPFSGTVFIDPYAQGNTQNYISYNKKDFAKTSSFFELPPIRDLYNANRPLGGNNVLAGVCVGTQLRTYRLALAATAEYTAKQGGTVALAQAAQATTLNRVNGIYERELSIRMVLVTNNNLLIYTNAASDPYTNNNGTAMLDENQTNINSVIGSSNYDIGHVFSTGGGGVAWLNVVCTAAYKAKGVTGSSTPSGDPFDIDYVAHEMGHQFGANHTFNSVLGFCEDNGVVGTNAEPGSGSTVMGYAGICSSDDMQAHSDAQFHAISLNEITAFSINGNGNSCAQITSTGNTPPVVNAGADYIIPKSTPFILTGSGTDANGDALTFSWEQIDVGGTFGAWNTPVDNAPLFRSFIPVASPTRFFPKLSDVINNVTTKGEILSSYDRAMDFRLTARDNRAGGGGVCFDETAVTVSGTAGPFLVTYPNATGITWLVNDFKTITWDPSGTAASPINCANVSIELSTNGGLTFTVTILASTPNDGIQEIQVPANLTSSARIRIKAVGNVFYDISNANFTIQNSAVSEFVFNSPMPVTSCSGSSTANVINTAALNGFSTTINLSATGNPAGTSVSFGTTTLSPGSSTSVTLNNINTLSSGVYNITVNGIAGSVNKSRIISFVVSGTPVAPALSSPSDSATGVSKLPSFNWTAATVPSFYKLEISTTNSFNTIIQTINNITALPFVLTTSLAENTVYYWRVTTTNGCGTGSPSNTGIFKTGMTVCSGNTKTSTDVPKTISAAGVTTINSTLTIPVGSAGIISDLNVVGLTGPHSFVSDITVTLTSPAGTSVVLFDGICFGTANFNINLDDEGGIDIPCPATGNQTARPQNSLTAFDGQNSAGVWTLSVRDNFDTQGGSLTGWGLVIRTCSYTAAPISTTPWTQICPPAGTTSLSSGLSGTSYQWEVNTGSGYSNVINNANYSGANTSTLLVSNAPSSWNGYQYRCLVDGSYSNTLVLGFTSYWNGSVSNAWETAANWSCNSIPDANTDVIINSGTVVVSSTALCRSMIAKPGCTVTINTGFKITVTH